MIQESLDLTFTHVGRVAIAMMKDEALDPVEIGSLGGIGITAGPHIGADPIQQFPRAGCNRRRYIVHTDRIPKLTEPPVQARNPGSSRT